jgi:hypothetical protein
MVLRTPLFSRVSSFSVSPEKREVAQKAGIVSDISGGADRNEDGRARGRLRRFCGGAGREPARNAEKISAAPRVDWRMELTWAVVRVR